MAKQSLNIPKGYFEVVNLHLPLPPKKKKRRPTKRQKLFTFYFVAQIQAVVDQMLAALVIIFLHTFLIICRNIAGISKSLSGSS
jgi:hypothetical protein